MSTVEGMTAKVSPPSRLNPVTIVGGVVGVILALLLLRWVVGWVFALIRLGVIVAIIAVVAWVALRLLTGGDDD